MSDVRKEIFDRLQSEAAGSNLEEANTVEEQEPIEGDPDLEPEVGEDDADDTEGSLDPEEGAEDGDPSDGEESEVDPEYKELEEKYKSLEAEYSRVTANRKEIESSLDNAKAETVQFKHQLEDEYTQAKQLTDYFAGMATQQLQQLQGINPATLSQEQFTQYQQALASAQQQSQQFQYMSQQVKEQLEAAREATKKREAEIARERLKARIPDWSSEKYRQLGDVAQEYGYSPQEFFDSTDHRLILLLNEVQKGKDAAKVVETRSKKTKSKPPKNRATRESSRNEKGQFTKAQKSFAEARPGTKGAFAQMKAAQLAAERKGK